MDQLEGRHLVLASLSRHDAGDDGLDFVVADCETDFVDVPAVAGRSCQHYPYAVVYVRAVDDALAGDQKK